MPGEPNAGAWPGKSRSRCAWTTFSAANLRNSRRETITRALTMAKPPFRDYPFPNRAFFDFDRQSGFWRPRWYIPKTHLFQRRLGARMALVSHVSWLGTQSIVYNVHLESRGNDALRCSQLAEILQDMQRYESALPIIVAGDFNFDLSKPPAASLLAVSPLNSPFQSGSVRPTTTRSRLGRARRIDWILTRGRLTSLGAELHDSVLASDHYPVSLTLVPEPVSGRLLRASLSQYDCR